MRDRLLELRFLPFVVLLMAMPTCRYDDIETIRRQASESANEVGNGLCFLDGALDILTIRATSYQVPTYCRLSDLATVSTDAMGSQNWDIGAMRFTVFTNSGTSHRMGNPGGQGGACIATQTDYNMVGSGACSNFMADQQTTTTGAGGVAITVDGSPVFSDWYDYDFNQHILKANSRNYLLRSGDNASVIYKMQFLDYYSNVGTPGYVRFRFARL